MLAPPAEKSPATSPRPSSSVEDVASPARAAPVTPSTTRRLVWRVDLLLQPALLLLYGLQYADKAVLGSASVAGILDAMQLSTQDCTFGHCIVSLDRYSTATSLFYAGYAAGVIPGAVISSVVARSPVRFLAITILLWGITVVLTPTISNFRTFYAARFFLGVLESMVSPGFVALTRRWYTRREHASRLGIWYSATGVFSMFSSLVNYGLVTIKNPAIAPWKVLYLFAGFFTILFGLAFGSLIPSSPEERPLLRIPRYNTFTLEQQQALRLRLTTTHEDQLLARQALVEDGAASLDCESDGKIDMSNSFPQAPDLPSYDAHNYKHEVIEAVLDIKIYLLCLIAFCCYLCNGAVTAFPQQLTKRIIGVSGAKSIALNTPSGATTAVSIYVVGWLSLRWRNSRIALLILSCLPVLAGAVIVWQCSWHNHAAVLAGLYLLPIFGAPYVMMLALATANIAGRLKSAVATGSIFLAYALSNIVAPYLFHVSEFDVHFRTTWITIIVAMCATIGLSLLLALVMAWDNRTRDREQVGITGSAHAPADANAKARPPRPTPTGLTDKTDRSFRYVF